jgi:hypothetical protein
MLLVYLLQFVPDVRRQELRQKLIDCSQSGSYRCTSDGKRINPAALLGHGHAQHPPIKISRATHCCRIGRILIGRNICRSSVDAMSKLGDTTKVYENEISSWRHANVGRLHISMRESHFMKIPEETPVNLTNTSHSTQKGKHEHTSELN